MADASEHTKHTIAVLVENKFGVLSRVAGLFSARAAGSAFTRTSSISRSTWVSSLRLMTLMTSMSLCSCFMTCSMTKASPATTSVIRETDGSSVSPTERLSML